MYLSVLVMSSLLVTIVSGVFFTISFKKLLDVETFSSYECGFSVMSVVRGFFSFRFFLITILFLIFDVEIVLMLPLPFLSLDVSEMFSIYIFMLVLGMGLVYEYYYGSLNWLNFVSKA